jgi:hypothetical protein
MAKENYSYGKRDLLFTWQKRLIHMAKETYSYGASLHDFTTRRPKLSTYENKYVCNTERKQMLRVEVDDFYGSGFRVQGLGFRKQILRVEVDDM